MVTGRYCLKKIEVRRTRATTEREDCRIRRMAVAHRTASSAKIQASLGPRVKYLTKKINILEEQLRDRLVEAFMHLTPNHIVCDFIGAQLKAELKSVVFSD
ncbi:hypothetical protein AVEN_25363-1 [Araneus ventricosus]|uniref:Uncharacterized protein n=1 Tax=Araneus ventricosus TaxID=182803 RepID=A0A4Y2EG25_ARAVE|nr:hypothetical protein AVEN_25363-1 [Araneus ventricosus]